MLVNTAYVSTLCPAVLRPILRTSEPSCPSSRDEQALMCTCCGDRVVTEAVPRNYRPLLCGLASLRRVYYSFRLAGAGHVLADDKVQRAGHVVLELAVLYETDIYTYPPINIYSI